MFAEFVSHGNDTGLLWVMTFDNEGRAEDATQVRMMILMMMIVMRIVMMMICRSLTSWRTTSRRL